MNSFLEQLKKEILSGIHPNWSKNQKLRYVYMKAGKKLTKDAIFFYSLGEKLGDAGLSYEELKRKYVENGVDENEVICKSTALFLKDIYEELGIETKLMKSDTFQRIYSKDGKEYFDVYHYFLCCTGDDDKKYFLTLSSDLMNIQNNWQTEHFANTITHQLREIHGKVNFAYQGDPIQETVMSLEELLALDYSIGLISSEKETHPAAGSSFVYYENGAAIDSITLASSPFVYQRAIGLMATRKGYSKYLSVHSDFYEQIFTFPTRDGKTISLNDTLLGDLKEADIDDWRTEMLKKIPSQDAKKKEEASKSVEVVFKKLKSMWNMAKDIRTMEEGEAKQKQITRLKKGKEAFYNLLQNLSSLFVPEEYQEPHSKKDVTTSYLKNRFETLFADIMMLNKEEPSMLRRCNGLAEKIELLDRVLMDVFGGEIFSKTKETAKVTRSVALNRETGKYHVFFQLNNELYYHLDLDTGQLKILPDVVEYISNQSFEFISDVFHAQILDIEDTTFTK